MQLRRKLVQAGKSLVAAALRPPSATAECDVLMTFPCRVAPGTVAWVLSHMKVHAPQLRVVVRSFGARHEPFTAFLISAAEDDRLLVCAEELCLRRKDTAATTAAASAALTSGAIHSGTHSCGGSRGSGDSNAVPPFTSLERQTMVHHMINCIRAKDGEKIGNISFIDGQAIVPELIAHGVIKQLLPLHDAAELRRLRFDWVSSFSKEQPIHAIKEYFGPHIGMYFAYLGHYTWALCCPAFLGLVLWVLGGGDQFSDDVIWVGFALFNVIWSTLYIEMWKRKSAELAYTWSTLDRKDDLIADPRPLFHGEPVVSPVTGRKEPFYSSWRRNAFFYLVSVPVISFSLLITCLVSLAFLTMYGHVKELVDKGLLLYPLKFVPMTLLGIAVSILDRIYARVAQWLNMKENYRLEEQYKNQLAIKLTLFQSVNAFMSLFYTAFYLQDFERLHHQLATLLIVRQIVSNMKESILTFGIAQLKQYINTKDDSEVSPEKLSSAAAAKPTAPDLSSAGYPFASTAVAGQSKSSGGDPVQDSGYRRRCTVSQAELESYMPRYEGTFDDYLEMAIQFGYVTWFSGVFPLAGLCALVNNVVEIRSDAFKLCASFQRPFGELARDIGAWEWVLEGMSMAALVVNAALIGVSGQVQRIFPGLTTAQAILLIVAVEHLVMVIKFYIRLAVSDVPEWVHVEMARLEFSRREALTELQSEAHNSLRPSSSPSNKSRVRCSSEGTITTATTAQPLNL